MGAMFVSGNTVASAAVRRRQRLSSAVYRLHHLFEAVRAQLKQIQHLLDEIVRLSM